MEYPAGEGSYFVRGTLVPVLVLAAVAAYGPGFAYGQAVTSAQGATLEDVIVTASRQGAESIQTIPMAISALSPETLERAGQGGLEDYTRTIPSVSLQSTGPGQNKIDIRGVTAGTFDYTDAQDRALVSVYLDDVPVSLAASNPELKVFDLERIEVIRGPQGTLYGAGSMAGTIRLITQKPKLDSVFGDVQTSISNTESRGINYDVRGMVNIPLVADRMALRVTGYRGEDSGFVNNLATGVDKYNSDTTSQARVALRAKVSDRLMLDASLVYMDLKDDGTQTGFKDLGAYSTSVIWPEGYKDHLHIYNLTATADVGIADLIASSSKVVRSNFNQIGGNQYLLSYYNFPPALGFPVVGANLTVKNDIDEWDNEIRLTSSQNEAFRWTAGAFFQNQHRTVRQWDPSDNFDARTTQALCIFYDLCDIPPYNSLQDGSFTPNADFSGLQHLNERQTAIFGEASYAVTDKLRLTAGVRYFNWKQDFDLYFGGFYGVQAPGVPLTSQDGAKVSGANPRFVAAYEFDKSHMMFVEAARGFRYGGVNQPLPLTLCAGDLAQIGLTNGPPTFGPDHLMSYSIGEKGRYLGNRLLFNATAFLIDWKDTQTKKVLPDCFYYFIQNKGDIQSKGLELETALRATERMTVGINASYTKAGAHGDIANLGASDGDPVPYFPRYIINGNGRYEIPLGSNTLSFQADWTFRARTYTEFNRNLDFSREIPDSDNLSAAVTYHLPQWEVGVFGQNLTTGTKILRVGYNGFPGVQPGDAITYARPRTVGLRLKMMF